MFVNFTESLLGFPANDSDPDLQSAFVYGPGFPILWVAAGSHVTILVITVVAAIIFTFTLWTMLLAKAEVSRM
jgi:hypothetical protein